MYLIGKIYEMQSDFPAAIGTYDRIGKLFGDTPESFGGYALQGRFDPLFRRQVSGLSRLPKCIGIGRRPGHLLQPFAFVV